MKELFDRYARYNTWMNERLYAVLADLPDEVRKADRGAFFRSIHGILNHILLGDSVWMGRFVGRPFPATSLDQELYSDFDRLRQARTETDREIQAWIAETTPERLASILCYVGITSPIERRAPLWHLVHHMFNHQTHHRGQLTTLLDQLGCDYGITDLAAMPDTP